MIELTQELKQKYQHYDQYELNLTFENACRHGYLDIVKYLLTSPDLKQHADIHTKENYGFRWACRNGHLEVVKYLLTSPDLVEHADIHAQSDYGFTYACSNGYLDIVKYLLTSPDLNDHVDIHVSEDLGLRWACASKHLDIVKYLLTSPELKEHADIHTHEDMIFESACEKGYLEIVTYLLSFDGEQCIDFQRTNYNLNWAIKNNHEDVIFSMIFNLQKNHFFEYIAYLAEIKTHSPELYSQIKNIELKNSTINPTVPELFL